MDDSEFTDVPRGAARLGTNPRHLRDLLSRREIPYTKIGRLVRLRISDLDAYVEKNTITERAS